ncbi:phytanoyl-CoA dioxygenase family protein [Streptomyces sp. NPDC056987]|uniref:phytanoyl-CoA dioxygenase family protein n=1 Tax=Streptomyces sp. NPDC056987 TaxID=3345988 RepID=UPI00363C8999
MLSQPQCDFFSSQGYLPTYENFSGDDLALLAKRSVLAFEQDSPGMILEKDGRTIRGVHGCHETDEVFARLVRHRKVLETAKELLGGDVYVHQFKINAKKALKGDVWPWHQDYIFWHHGDGMRTSQAVNIAILLDEATDFNGPLLVLPGSHRIGMIDPERGDRESVGRSTEPDWRSHLNADLHYTLDAGHLAELTRDSRIVAMKGPAGTVFAFDPLIVHASGSNMSPDDRGMLFITYNRTDNTLGDVSNPLPSFLAARDYTPLQPLAVPTLLPEATDQPIPKEVNS